MIALHNEIISSIEDYRPKTSGLAVMSFLLGLTGILNFGPILILLFYGLSLYDILGVNFRMTITFSSCVWILGLALGKKSLTQITKSQEHLAGRGYAATGAAISGLCLVLFLIALFYPAIRFINS
jgi:hypothetical protein